LRDQKVEVEKRIFPEEVHDFLLHEHVLRAFHAAADFFDRRLRGP
jgi:dipeptidyl aminopeptidase/acylaminoacyl peptidase